MTHIIAIDQGTTSSRAIVFDADMRGRATAQQEFPQHFPQSGWVEHDPEDIWTTVTSSVRGAIDRAGITSAEVAAIGITNQRETTLLWDRATGAPLHRAIVWQDRRTAPLCARLKAEGHEPFFTERTGLLVDPYFSATKLSWLLDEIPGARARAERGGLAFGTVDTFLIWRLTGGRVHATDATNAARTMLFNIHRQAWDEDILSLLSIPRALLPEVRDCAADYGTTRPDLFGRAIPILGVAGDQQAATIGQACFQPGMVKSTYGTGCFALLNTGEEVLQSRNRLLSTVAYRLKGRTTYALEGSIFIAGAVVQWLRDAMGLLKDASEAGAMAAKADPGQSLILVPAFTGLGAPYWSAESRGAVFGLTRASGPAEFARAALESVGHQTRDLIEAMRADGADLGRSVLRVDGGMARSDWTMQYLADMLGAPVDRPVVTETTALGAAWLAGSEAGIYPGAEGFAARWQAERRFTPAMGEETRLARHARWLRAVRATMSV
jgi:glycerol kinase